LSSDVGDGRPRHGRSRCSPPVQDRCRQTAGRGAAHQNRDDARRCREPRKQIEDCRRHGLSPVVAVSTFPTDHPSELDAIRLISEEAEVRAAPCTHFSDDGRSGRGIGHVRPALPRLQGSGKVLALGMDYLDQPLGDFLERLAGRRADPGRWPHGRGDRRGRCFMRAFDLPTGAPARLRGPTAVRGVQAERSVRSRSRGCRRCGPSLLGRGPCPGPSPRPRSAPGRRPGRRCPRWWWLPHRTGGCRRLVVRVTGRGGCRRLVVRVFDEGGDRNHCSNQAYCDQVPHRCPQALLGAWRHRHGHIEVDPAPARPVTSRPAPPRPRRPAPASTLQASDPP